MILRSKHFTLSILKYNIFQVVTSWLDTVLSLFLHTVDDGFCDFWTIACYLLTDSYFLLSDGLRIIFIHSFFLVSPEKNDRGIENLATDLAIQHSKLKSEFFLKLITQRWHARNKIDCLNIQWTDFKNQGRVRNLRENEAGRHNRN